MTKFEEAIDEVIKKRLDAVREAAKKGLEGFYTGDGSENPIEMKVKINHASVASATGKLVEVKVSGTPENLMEVAIHEVLRDVVLKTMTVLLGHEPKQENDPSAESGQSEAKPEANPAEQNGSTEGGAE